MPPESPMAKNLLVNLEYPCRGMGVAPREDPFWRNKMDQPVRQEKKAPAI